MGIFRPFIGGVKDLEAYQAVDNSNDHAFTPADVMTVARPLLAIKAARMLLNGEQGVFPVVATMAASDMEGKPARLIDRYFPNSGWGSTQHGAEWDPIADTTALIIVGAAIMKAPRITTGAKIATAAILGQEGTKASWALFTNGQYKKLSGKKLSLPSSEEGKEAMAEKLSAIGLAVATNDTDDLLARTALTAASLYFAGTGVVRGEKARREYLPIVAELMNQEKRKQQ